VLTFRATLLAAWTFSSLSGSVHPSPPTERRSPANPQAAFKTSPPAAGPRWSYTVTQMGEGVAEGAPRIAETTYKRSDGAILTVGHAQFASAELASRHLDKLLAQASKVLSGREKKYRNGTAVGDRIEIMFRSAGKPSQVFAIYWTDGTDFYGISSASLQVALEFEKHPPPPYSVPGARPRR
jgi:hypothetical protein